MKTPIIEGISKLGLESYLNARKYERMYWQDMFPVKPVNTLDGKTLIGEVGSRVAAYIISYDAKAPEASRKVLQTKYFDIPKIAISRRKTEKEILEHAITKALRGQDAVIEDYFNDIDFVWDAVMGRIEWLVLSMLSKGKIKLDATNNPQGIVNESVVDFGLPAANKKVVGVVWSTANLATMTPITDFKAVIQAARAKGVRFERILMHPNAFDLMIGSTEFQNSAKSLIAGQSVVLGNTGIETANTILKALDLPAISVIDTAVGIEDKGGNVSESNPWAEANILFVPTLNLGQLYSGPIAEEIEKPDGVIQAKRENVMVSMKRSFDPVSVLTKGESNSFPSWPTVNRCFNLYTGSASTWA